MTSLSRACLPLAAFLASFLLPAVGAVGHTADTSYARVRIHEDRLEVRLTCDIFTLGKMVPGFRATQDRVLSKVELQRVTPLVQEFFSAHVGLEINGKPVAPGQGKDAFWPQDAPDPIPFDQWHDNAALISFPFEFSMSKPAKDVALTFDLFHVLGYGHTVLGTFEYRGTTTEVIFNHAEPDYLFDLSHATATLKGGRVAAGATRGIHRSNVDDSPAWRFFKSGVTHILTGYDHLCFLLALLVFSRLRPLVAIVTSFTVAHSVTLLLAAFGVVTLPARLIESAIALTIVFVGVENLWRCNDRHRWVVTFFLGLIHGFGFANTLDPQELPLDAKMRCLLAFNLGVEAGQLAVVAALLPASLLLAKWRYGRRAKQIVSLAVALLGLAWFLDRILALGWMPF